MSTTQATTNLRPLQAALEAAFSAHEGAENAYDECECEILECEHYAALVAAAAAVDAARDALRDSDEDRDWILREEGYDYDTVEASSAEDALEEARGNANRANYSDAEGTIWITVSVRCEETGEEERDTVALEEEEPECESGGEHDWQSPHEIVGGLLDNPGVWGHGGGVILREVCMRCGCGRITDTWAQNRETGEQGLKSVTYASGAYSEEVYEMRLAAERIEVIALLDQYVHSAEECEREKNTFYVAWVDDDADADIVAEIQRELPAGWSCEWTGDGNTDADGCTTSDFVVEPDWARG